MLFGLPELFYGVQLPLFLNNEIISCIVDFGIFNFSEMSLSEWLNKYALMIWPLSNYVNTIDNRINFKLNFYYYYIDISLQNFKMFCL